MCRMSTDCRSTFDILLLKVFLSEEVFHFIFFFFLCCVRKLTYHKCIFNFPLLLIQIRAEKPAFFSLSCHKSHSFRAFLHNQTLVMNFLLSDLDLEGAVEIFFVCN